MRNVAKLLSDEPLEAAPGKSAQVNDPLKTKAEAARQTRVEGG